jgi:hypothetical protein
MQTAIGPHLGKYTFMHISDHPPRPWTARRLSGWRRAVTNALDRLGETMRTLYEEFRIYYLPWIVAGAAVAVILWQQRTAMDLIERINDNYLERLTRVTESLERINTTLRTEGYTLPPLGGVREPDKQVSH